MIPTERTDRIQDSIHLLQCHTVHGLVQCAEVRLDPGVIQSVDLAVGFVQKRQDGVGVTKAGRIVCDMFSQCVDVFFHKHHLQSVGDVNSLCRKFQVSILPNLFP